MTFDPLPLLAAIESAVTAEGVAYAVGRKPTVTTGRPWVVAWPDGGSIADRSLRSRDGWSMVVTFQCYGTSPESPLIASRVVRGAVLAMHLVTVGDRVLLMPTPLASPRMTRDDDVDPPLWMQADEWRFRTTPA